MEYVGALSKDRAKKLATAVEPHVTSWDLMGKPYRTLQGSLTGPYVWAPLWNFMGNCKRSQALNITGIKHHGH